MTPPKHWERFDRAEGAPEDSAPPAAKAPAKFVIRPAAPPKSIPWPAWAVLAAVLLGFSWKMMHRPDPEFLRAQRMVADFERGKDADSINYKDPVYDDALEHLRAVAPVSGSAGDAARMSVDILRKRKAFEARLVASQAQIDKALADQAARTEAVLRGQQSTTGTDPDAAARLAAAAPAECQEERHRRAPSRPGH